MVHCLQQAAQHLLFQALLSGPCVKSEGCPSGHDPSLSPAALALMTAHLQCFSPAQQHHKYNTKYQIGIQVN